MPGEETSSCIAAADRIVHIELGRELAADGFAVFDRDRAFKVVDIDAQQAVAAAGRILDAKAFEAQIGDYRIYQLDEFVVFHAVFCTNKKWALRPIP